jgi:hypothetical protein
VVKLFVPAFAPLAAAEFERSRSVHAAGAPCPAVHEMVEVDGRIGIVFERLAGPPLIFGRGAAGLLLAREPDTAFADEMMAPWISP